MLHPIRHPFRPPARFALSVALVVILALVIFTLLMRPTMQEFSYMAIFLTITSVISFLVGFLSYRLGRVNLFPRLQISLLAGYALSSLLTFLNVWITARLMFTSPHDLLLATVLLIFAGGIAMIFGAFFTQSLIERLSGLNAAARQIAQGKFDVRVAEGGRDEMAELAASFNAMASQLQKAEQRQQELETLRRDLVAWVGHDLQTPLASIRAIVEALADGLIDEPATTQRYLSVARKDIQALSALIDDLFQMAQLDAGGLQLELADGSISDLISDTLESFTELARRKGIRLDGRVDPASDPIRMDAKRVGRVLTNLVDNALRYTPSGGSVFLQARPSPEGVLVEVTDTGPGISAEDAAHVFERFYRGEKSRSRPTPSDAPGTSGGAGLGLAIARGIVEAHGGKIDVSSEPGQGTCFYFTLPRQLS
jgi:signal transduction histidine kinase